MAKEFWINLPVRDIQKSKKFFTKLGFKFNTKYRNSEDSACLLLGDKNVVVMLFEEPSFKNFTKNRIADTSRGTEVLLSIDAQNVEEVDEMVQKAIKAGGSKYCDPHDEGWLYGSGFTDLDGHRWNVLFMDMNEMPKQA